MQTDVSCQPSETGLFNLTNIGKCQRDVGWIQRKLDLAVAKGDKSMRIGYDSVDWVELTSQATYGLSTGKVTENFTPNEVGRKYPLL